MSPTTRGSVSSHPSAAESGSGRRPERSDAGRRRGPHDTVGFVIWSAVILLLGLGLFYGWRTISNRERLIDRNLRELDRMGRTVEARIESRLDILERLAGRERTEWNRQAALIPDLARDAILECDEPRIRIDRTIDLCVTTEARGASASWTLDPVRRALDTDLFDAVFVADPVGGVALMAARAGGIRMREIPPADSSRIREAERSTVRSAEIAGRDYMIFLQPLRIRSPDYTNTDSADAAPQRWAVGGLVSTPGFRAESLALGTRHLVFLGLLVMLTILGLPFLRVALMGPWERVNVRDVYLLGFSLVVTSGLLGLVLGDLSYYVRLTRTMDRDLESLACRMVGSFRGEVRSALDELQRRNGEFENLLYAADFYSLDFRKRPGDGEVPDTIPVDWLRSRTTIFPEIPEGWQGERATKFLRDTLDGRYVSFQMVFWTDPSGMQLAKWTPRESNTSHVLVNDRPYYTRIREGTGWPLAGLRDETTRGDGEDRKPTRRDDAAGLHYFVQSLRSKTTGENVTAISLPFCWGRSWDARPCPREARGVSVILAPLASVDRPVLPPGVEFAVIEPDGRTLYHSRPERNLDENFFEETEDHPALRSLVAARTGDQVSAVYMGRPSRVRVEPIPSTPLTLVVVHDDRYLGTVHFQTLFFALSMFGAWLILLGMLVLFVELATPGRLQWVWPDPRHPEKYRVLIRVLGGFALLLVVQSVLAIRYPVHPSTLVVPVQALALGLVVLAKGVEQSPLASGSEWRSAPVLGWALLVVATVVQLALHLPPGWYLLLWLLQIGVVWWASGEVRTLTLGRPLEANSRDPVRISYVVSAALTLAVVGLLPAVLLYQEAFAESLDRLVRHHQVKIVEGLGDRAVRLRAANREGGLPEAFDPLVIDGPSGVAHLALFAPEPVPPAPRAPRNGSDSLRDDEDTEWGDCRWESRATLRRTVESLAGMPSWYATGVAADMGGLTRPEKEGFEWSCAGNLLRLDAGDHTLRSAVPSGLWLPTGWWGLGAVLGVGILLWIPSWAGRRVFIMDLDYASPTALADHLSGSDESMIVVCTRSMNRDDLRRILREHGIRYVDLLDLRGGDEAGNATKLEDATSGEEPICLDHFDQQLGDEAWGRPLLARLEELVHVEERTVLLITSREPSALFPRSAEIARGGSEATYRWIRLLGQFVKVRIISFLPEKVLPEIGAPRDRAGLERDSELGAVLEYESSTHPVLRKIAARLRTRIGPEEVEEGFTSETLIEQIREMADSYYHALWSILEREERLVVGQLAAGAVVNPKCERTVRRLLERKILVLEPELRLMNESFARFVQEEIPPETVAVWERDERSSAWQRLRFPIVLAVGAVAAFLFVTQRTTFDAVIAILSTAAVGATAAVRLITVARSSEGKS